MCVCLCVCACVHLQFHPVQVCSGAGKALALMMTGENDLVHDLVSAEMAPGRVVEVANAVASL